MRSSTPTGAEANRRHHHGAPDEPVHAGLEQRADLREHEPRDGEHEHADHHGQPVRPGLVGPGDEQRCEAAGTDRDESGNDEDVEPGDHLKRPVARRPRVPGLAGLRDAVDADRLPRLAMPVPVAAGRQPGHDPEHRADDHDLPGPQGPVAQNLPEAHRLDTVDGGQLRGGEPDELQHPPDHQQADGHDERPPSDPQNTP